MMGGQHSSPTLEGSTFATHGSRPPFQQDTCQQRKGRPWCDHCAKPGHTKDKCWKIHNKPANWRPSKSNFDRDSRANSATAVKEQPPAVESSPFTKEQLEVLQKLLSNTLSQHTAVAPFASMHAQAGNLLSAFSMRDKCSKNWNVDSGASNHMTGDESIFDDYQPCHANLTVHIAEGYLSKVAGIGLVQRSPEITLKSVLHAPKLDCNLISISKLTRDNHFTKFFPNVCIFQGLGLRKKISSAEMCSGLYLLKIPQPRKASLMSSGPSKSQVTS